MDLSSLVYLACPIGMGLMMWMMMRGKSPATHEPGAASAAGRVGSPETRGVERLAGSRVFRMAGMCFDRRVIAGLAAVGLATWLLAPGLMAGVLPLLVLAACPLSMLLMMRGMGRSRERQAALTSESEELERDTATAKVAPANGHAERR